MDDRGSIDLQRLAALFGALAPVVLELGPDDGILLVHGDPSGLMGEGAASLMGRRFTDFIEKRDQSIWRLLRHKLLKATKVGPVPLHLMRAGGAGAADIHAVRVPAAPVGTIQIALSPYHGLLAVGENRRPTSSAARQFRKEDFAAIARRLTDYAASNDCGVSEALMKLAGLEQLQPTEGAEAHLWALYRLLHDAASEGAASNLSAEKRANPPDGGERTAAPAVEAGVVKQAMRGAYVKARDETNYVTVAGEDGISEAEAVKAAIYAMKKAATAGGARTMEALTGGYEKRLETVKNQLRVFKRIVLQEHFDVALQPIVDIKTGALHHFEALARFDQQYYAGSPFEFMCFAEDVGVIHEFDLAMTLKVISLIKRMRRIGYSLSAAVNISGRSIQSQAFLRHFFRILEDCGDIRANLMFELTESSQIDDLETTNRILSRIRDFGHKVSLDDFGAGAAGLQYLRVLKVDCVKIDGIYIRKGIEDPQNRSFLRSMAELCTGLGIETVGECVENEEQRQFLEEIGVRYGQGWLYGKPVPIEDSLHFLEGRG